MVGKIWDGEYLTLECKDCPMWRNDEHTIGCGSHYPIKDCPAYQRAEASKEPPTKIQ